MAEFRPKTGQVQGRTVLQHPDEPSSVFDDGGAEACEERVILVDEQDRPLGSAEKLAAHRDGGLLHRAFSVFLFDDDGRMLLQQRAATKYHFPLLWTNACCGHPRPGEALVPAAQRRVREELGVAVGLEEVFAFLYAARDEGSALCEREYDHVLVGRLASDPRPEVEEVAAFEWQEASRLALDVEHRPTRYTPWFRIALPELLRRLPMTRPLQPARPASDVMDLRPGR